MRQQPLREAGSAAPVQADSLETTPAAVSRDGAMGRVVRQTPPISATRMALTARAAELARLDVIYLRHDLRNVGFIAGLMLAIIVALSFVLH